TPDPIVTDDPGAGDTVVETPQSTPDADRTPARQPSHNADGGGSQTASAAPTVPTTGEDTTVDTVAPSSDGYPGAWSGQDTFVVASLRASLGVALVLPRDRLRTFRMPAVSWRPLAYVPPIELPG